MRQLSNSVRSRRSGLVLAIVVISLLAGQGLGGGPIEGAGPHPHL